MKSKKNMKEGHFYLYESEDERYLFKLIDKGTGTADVFGEHYPHHDDGTMYSYFLIEHCRALTEEELTLELL
jgi:hypothetical protein